ncbi:MAG: M48 family metallopeptidase [Algicola sp.]|nr:M48 family metallopeptidase [Algicola sp.]
MSIKHHVADLWHNPHKRNWLFIGLGALLVMLVVVYKAHTRWIPDIAEYIAQELPREIYQSVGDSTLESLDDEQFKPSTLSENKQNEIREKFGTMVVDLALDSTRYQLHFRDWEEGINAFALMNGAIVVTDALVQTLDESLQLNAVLLHEIGHINNNHLMENTLRVSIFYVTLSMIVGDISVVADLLVEASAMGLNFSFSREFELEADAYAAKSMLQLYNTADPAIKAFEALEIAHQADAQKQAEDTSPANPDKTPSEVYQWLSSHPPTRERIEHIQQIVEESQSK